MTIGPDDVRARMRLELSMPVRLGYAALGAAGLSMAGLAVSLLLTEPILPTRTQVAFGAIAVAGLAWAGYAVWVLRWRRVLFARHRVRAAQLAVAICGIFFLGAAIAGPPAGAAALVNGALTVVAALWYLHARRRVSLLESRRRELEREAGGRR
jgi:hypothetical protein